jgi:predicted dehydrogenase
MKRIRIGQIGTGHFHAEATLATALKYPDVFEVVGIAEVSPEAYKTYRNKKTYQGLTWMTPEELLANPDLDAVLVETNEWDLVPVAQKCMDAGVHVHLDKPAGEDIDAYAKLLRQAKHKQLLVQLGYMYRYNPAIQYCYQALANQELGEIFEIDAVMSTEHVLAVRQYLSRFRGGTMYIFGCHLIDLLISFMGKPERIIPFQGQTGFDGVAFYDNGIAVFEYPKGACSIRTSSLEVKGYDRRQLVICGSKGTIEIKPLENPTVMTVAMADHSKGPAEYLHDHHAIKRTIDLPELPGRYDTQLLDFAAMIRGEKANPFTYEHELLVQQATLKASGFDISLDEIPL